MGSLGSVCTVRQRGYKKTGFGYLGCICHSAYNKLHPRINNNPMAIRIMSVTVKTTKKKGKKVKGVVIMHPDVKFVPDKPNSEDKE